MATEVASLVFEADTTRLRRARDELGGIDKAANDAQASSRKFGTDLKKAANDSVQPLERARSSVNGLQAALVALASSMVIRQFISYTDQWTDLNSRLVNATGSAEAADAALDALSQTAKTTYTSLQQTAEAFLMNSMALSEMGYTTQQQIALSDAMNNALVISGTKGQRAASVMDALSKALALGQLNGQNFNTVIQSGGRLVQALADGLGVTTQELRRMSTEGLLTTETIIESMTSQVGLLREEAAAMPATIGDAFVQLGNFAFEAIGQMDKAAGLSAAIADSILRAVNGLRAAYLPTGQQKFNELLRERQELEDRYARATDANARRRYQVQIDNVNKELEALRDANIERQKAEMDAHKEGIKLRSEAEAQREADHQAELQRIADESAARIRAREEERRLADITRQQNRKREGSKIENLAEIERQQNEKRFSEMVRWNNIEAALDQEVSNRKIEFARQQTEQLLAFDNVLLQGRSQSAKAAYSIGVNLMNQEKRQAAGKIVTDSYSAAMAAWRSLAGIPFIGPALGAAAAGTILAAGVSYSAKALAGRALGGQVRSGESYVVGERGPEVLTMGSTNGKVIPNSSLSKAQASGTINKTANVNFNITANDAAGFEDMLNFSRGKIIDIINMAMNETGQGALT
jgi:tape measure domain-containing protein